MGKGFPTHGLGEVLPDGRTKLILRNKESGQIIECVAEESPGHCLRVELRRVGKGFPTHGLGEVLPDGRRELILRNKESGQIIERVEEEFPRALFEG